MQPKIHRDDVSLAMRVVGAPHQQYTVVDVDNYTSEGKRVYLVSILCEQQTPLDTQEKLARALAAVLRERGFAEGEVMTIERLFTI